MWRILPGILLLGLLFWAVIHDIRMIIKEKRNT